MAEAVNAMPLDRGDFRDVVRNPEAHAAILGQYRIGEYAGVVLIPRILAEMAPDDRLRRAVEIHLRDEARHTQVFTDWITRLGIAPQPFPTEIESFFAASPEEFAERRKFVDQLPADIRRILTFAGINAIERLAYDQFEHHLMALDRREDREALAGVIAEEKFHLNYVEAELERQSKGENGAFVTMALEQARTQFEAFRDRKQAETHAMVERALGREGVAS